MMSGLILFHDLPAGDLANARPRHASGVDLHFECLAHAPSRHNVQLAVRQQAVVVEINLPA